MIQSLLFFTFFNTQKRLDILKPFTSEIICVDFADMKTDRAFDTFTKLAQKLKFNAPKYKHAFEGRANEVRAI